MMHMTLLRILQFSLGNVLLSSDNILDITSLISTFLDMENVRDILTHPGSLHFKKNSHNTKSSKVNMLDNMT